MDDSPTPRDGGDSRSGVAGKSAPTRSASEKDGWKQMGAVSDDEIELAGGEPAEQFPVAVAVAGAPVERGEVAALVNGQPIFFDDVLVPFTPQLKMARAQLPPAEYRKFRKMLAEKHLGPYVDQQLLLQALKRKIKPEQFEGIEKQLNQQVDEELKKTMQRLNVSSIGELEIELRKSDLSVEAMRTMVRNRKLAEQFLASKAMPRDGFDRPDVVAYYKEHVEDFKVEGTVKWQQIQISNAKNDGPGGAAKLAESLSQQLRDGADFDELAREHSEGPTAEEGGIRDWTTQGSLAATEVDRMLFELPVGSVSEPLVVKGGVWIVKVLDRRDAGYRQFDEVQNEIKDLLRKERFTKAVQATISELKDQADVVMFPGFDA